MPLNKKKCINLGLIGFGTVGSGVVQLLLKNHKLIRDRTGIDFNLHTIADLDIKSDRGVKLPYSIKLTTKAEDIINNKEIDIVIELIGGINPAKKFILNSFQQGKHVVTANKALLSQFGKEIFSTAEKYKKLIGFEASVAGGVPIIKVIRESLTANRIKKIYGIVNGTTNFILTRMEEENLEFEEALKIAQNNGFAEADPTLDIEGIDAAHKIQILASYAFNGYVNFKEIYVEGIKNIDFMDIKYLKELGYKIRLLAIAKYIDKNLIECHVNPTILPLWHPLATIRNEYNAVYIESDGAGPQIYYGKGAGSLPTASAVIADIIDIGKKIILSSYTENQFYSRELKVKNMTQLTSRYYFKFFTVDKPGVLARIAGILGKHKISISSVIQKETGTKVVPIVMLTHKAKEENVIKALKEIQKLNVVKGKPKFIRIEDNDNSE